MALSGINSVGRRERKPSALEQIALGVDIASKVLGAGLQTYSTIKGVGEAQDKLKQSKESIDLNRAQLFKAATPEEIQAGKAEDVPGVPGKWVYREKPESALDVIAKSLGIQKTQNDIAKGKKELNAPVISKGQEAVDAKFAEDYNNYVAQGGYTTIGKNLNQLKMAVKSLSERPELSGGISRSLPMELRDVVDTESAALQQMVEEAIQSNLKTILGSAFTEKESRAVIERAYNPRLPASKNIENLSRTIAAQEAAAKAKQSAVDWFEKNNSSLKGFKGQIPDFSKVDFSGAGSNTHSPTAYDQDVLDYAKAHNISPDQALKIKQMRTQ